MHKAIQDEYLQENKGMNKVTLLFSCSLVMNCFVHDLSVRILKVDSLEDKTVGFYIFSGDWHFCFGL